MASSDLPIVYPPPDIRKVIDKTASFVAAHGQSFEEKAKKDSSGRLQFLAAEHPFRPYYDLRVQEFKDGADANAESVVPEPEALKEIKAAKEAKLAREKAKKEKKSGDAGTGKTLPKAIASFAANANAEVFEAAKTGAPLKMLADGKADGKMGDGKMGDGNMGDGDGEEGERTIPAAERKQKLLSLEEEVVEPAPDSYTVILQNIAPFDVDIMKTTAQFTARNGGAFLEELTKRESQNPQFDFMRPGHQ